MMIRTAGGPGTVSPIDFHERKTPRFSRTTWTALGIVITAHLGLGMALYYQRFEMAHPVVQTDGDIIELEMYRPKPEPKPVVAKQPPAQQAPNTKFNETPLPATPTEVIEAAQGDKPAEGPAISISQPAEPDATGTAVDPAPPAPPPVISSPTWISQPSADQLMRAYPDRAIQRGIGGTVRLNCLVQPNGSVSDCRTTSEPEGSYGFGRAAHSLTRYFKIAPRTVNGAAEGSRVNIAIRFTPPAE